MKKVISTVLATVMLLGVVGATGCDKNMLKKEKWSDKAVKEVEEELSTKTCTQFYLEGEVYEFPCEVNCFLDNGWEFKDATTADKELASWEQSDYIYNLKKDDKLIEVGMTNISDETLPIKDCMVDSLKLYSASGDVMIPSGLTMDDAAFYGNFDEFNEAVDMDDENLTIDEKSKTAHDYTFEFEGDDGYDISVTFNVYHLEYAGNKERMDLLEAEYTCAYFIDYDFCDDLSSTLKAVLENNPSLINPDYIKETPEEYVGFYRSANGIPGLLASMMGFEFDTLTDDQIAMMDSVIAALYDCNSCNMIPVDYEKVTISITYYDFFDICDKAYDMLLESGMNVDNYSTDEACYEYMCNAMVEVINNRTDLLIMPHSYLYTAYDTLDSTCWDDSILLALGLAELVEE